MPLGTTAFDSHVLQVLSRLTDAIARAGELRDIYDAALDALGEGLGVDRASILLFDADDVVRFVAWRGLSDAYRAAVEGHSPWRPDSPDPKPIFVPDVEHDSELAAYRATFAAEGIGSLAFVPLVASGRVLGKFMCYYGSPRAFSPVEIALASTIAQQVAFAVERTRTYDAMRWNQERLRFALTAASMGTWDWDLRSNRVDWSDNLAQVHGLPSGAFDGSFQSYEREIHPDDKVRVLESISRAISLGVPHEVEYRIVAPDGSVRWVEGKGRVEYGSRGEPVRMGGTCMDITRRKLAELERTELATRAAFLADVSATLARSLDYATTLQTVASSAVPRIADWCAVHMRRQDGSIAALAVAHADPSSAGWLRERREVFRVHPGDGYGVAFAMRANQSLLYPDVSEAQIHALVSDPGLRDALLTLRLRSVMVVPMRASGEVAGAITFMTVGDSARRFGAGDLALAEEVALHAGVAVENARLYSAAQEANRLKDEFLATLSHELRTPLNAMLGWARMLEKGHVAPERQLQAITTIKRNAEAQAHLISDILDVARITSNKLHLELTPVDVSETIRLAADAMESQARDKRVRITVLAEPGLTARADAARLQQMAWNLLSNAVKFTPAGGDVRVEVGRADGGIRIQVTDTGLGIEPDFLPHLFERFRQADASTTRAHGGLGLGLAITRHLAEMHGGTVEAASEGPGRGATFTLHLPLMQALPLPAAPPAASSKISAAARLAGCRVLAVDDDHDSRQLVCELFARAGAKVRTARSVAEAIEAITTSAFDLVIADIAMPDEDGFSLIDRLSEMGVADGRRVPAIAVTAYAREEDRVRVLSAGFAAHVAKPIDDAVLLETAATLVREAAGPRPYA